MLSPFKTLERCDTRAALVDGATGIEAMARLVDTNGMDVDHDLHVLLDDRFGAFVRHPDGHRHPDLCLSRSHFHCTRAEQGKETALVQTHQLVGYDPFDVEVGRGNRVGTFSWSPITFCTARR